MKRFCTILAVCSALAGAVLFFERPTRAQYMPRRPLIPERPPVIEPFRPGEIVDPYRPHIHPFLEPSHPGLQPLPNPWGPQGDALPQMPWDGIQIPDPPAYDYEAERRQQAERRAAAVNAVERQLARSAGMGLDALVEHRGDLLPEDQSALTRRIVARLATQVDATADAWQARRAVLDLQERFRQANLEHGGFAELRALVDRRCLDERLADVLAFLLADDTQQAARLVKGTLAELAVDKAAAPELGKGGELAGDVVHLNRELEALSHAEAALQGAGPERRARLLQVDTSNAPEAVTRSLNDLRELESVRAALAQPGKVPLPAAARIEAALIPAARAAAGDPAAGRLRQDVSARLYLEGRPGEARKVLAGVPAGAESREHAAALLRDLKAAVLGEGKGPTITVTDAERLEGKLEGRVAAEARQARTNGDEQTQSLARQIQNHLRSAGPPARGGPEASGANPGAGDEDDLRDLLAAVIEELGRPLTAPERDVVRARHRALKARQEIVKELRGAAQP